MLVDARAKPLTCDSPVSVNQTFCWASIATPVASLEGESGTPILVPVAAFNTPMLPGPPLSAQTTIV